MDVENHKNEVLVAYATGTYDMVHEGHFRFFELINFIFSSLVKGSLHNFKKNILIAHQLIIVVPGHLNYGRFYTGWRIKVILVQRNYNFRIVKCLY